MIISVLLLFLVGLNSDDITDADNNDGDDDDDIHDCVLKIYIILVIDRKYVKWFCHFITFEFKIVSLNVHKNNLHKYI